MPTQKEKVKKEIKKKKEIDRFRILLHRVNALIHSCTKFIGILRNHN